MEIYRPITEYFRPTLSIVVLLKNIGFVHNLAENTVKQPILHITYSEILGSSCFKNSYLSKCRKKRMALNLQQIYKLSIFFETLTKH